MASSTVAAHGQANTTSSGIYTRTIVRSPVVRWILHAQIRDLRSNDAVFIGEDYIEVKEVGKNGHLEHIAVKEDFDAHIIAAAVFNTSEDDDEANFLAKIKPEASQDNSFPSHCPPQLVVLTLDSGNLVFIGLKLNDENAWRFVQCIVPLPLYERKLFQPGQHLAIDPLSRALAVAAREDQLVLYGTKPKDQIRHELSTQPSEFCPISSTRPFKVEGVIQHADFLQPPSTSSNQVILLLIIICQGRTKAAVIDWVPLLGPRHAQLHSLQLLDESETVPSLLIPLRDAAFFLVTDNEIVFYKDILSGSVTVGKWSLLQEDPHYPGLSACSPVWTSWVKPRRSKAAIRDKDAMYLAREDGLVIWIDVKVGAKPTLNVSRAGDLECHVGTAFASVGDDDGPDILAVAGETSTGRTVSIGPFFNPGMIEMSREEAMRFEKIELLSNWASATDMISAKRVHANRHHSAYTDNVLVTSGRQPYGAVTEIRRGLEGRVSVRVPFDALRSVTNIWAVPDLSVGSAIIVLSSPMGTRLLRIVGDCDDIEVIHDMTAFDLSQPTLTAGSTASGQLVQVTRHGFCVTGDIQGNFEDTKTMACQGDALISAAVIVYETNMLVTAEEDGDGCHIRCYSVSLDNEPNIQRRASASIESKILSIAALHHKEALLIAVSTADGTVTMITFKDAAPGSKYTQVLPRTPETADTPSICDHIALLEASHNEQSQDFSVVCGSRDGRIVTFAIDFEVDQPLVPKDVITFRDSTVKLVPLNSKHAVYAFSGTSICLLSWDGISTSLESIWLADKAEPEMAQPSIVACAQTPMAMWLSSSMLADSLALASEDELYFAAVQPQTTTVPRQIPVDGTPNRLIHAQSLRNIVCSAVYADVRTFPSSRPHNPPEERRQTWPIIHFIPSSRGDEPSYQHHMQPGDRVNALLEWSYKASSNKTYSFILVGGKHRRRSGHSQGRVTFLQLSLRNWRVEAASKRYTLEFPDEVYALAQLHDRTIVVSAGEFVYYYAYREEHNDWQRVNTSGAQDSVRIASPGTYITANSQDERSDVAISTYSDSLVVLDGSGDIVAMGPHAQDLFCHHIITDDLTKPHVPSVSPQELAMFRSKEPQAGGMSDEQITQILTREKQHKMRQDNRTLALVSTRRGEISGLSWFTQWRRNQSSRLEFTAKLRRSLTRLVPSTPPARKGSPPEGIFHDRVVGCATDGALVGMVLIDTTLWRRLSWLQRLIEWSPVLSPHAQQTPTYDRMGSELSGITNPERGLPIGLKSRSTDDLVLLQPRIRRENDLHIDGDVLARGLESPGAVRELRNVMSMLASETERPVGRWMMEHLDEEMQALEEVVELVRSLERWMV